MPTGDNTRIDVLSIVNLECKLLPLIQFPHSYNENDNTWYIVVNAWQMMAITCIIIGMDFRVILPTESYYEIHWTLTAL